jgi:hypothetical protein
VKPQGEAYFCSPTPREIEAGLFVGAQVADAVTGRHSPVSESQVKALLAAALDVLKTHEVVGADADADFYRIVRELRPLDAMAYLAATYFECQTFVLVEA